MELPRHQTKIVATVGPASATPEIMADMIRAGEYPVEAVAMLGRIAAAIEPRRIAQPVQEAIDPAGKAAMCLPDLIARAVVTTTRDASPAVVIVPTRSGATARSIARFRLPVWITAVSSLASTCRNLQFSYGVQPVHVPEHPGDWKALRVNGSVTMV